MIKYLFRNYKIKTCLLVSLLALVSLILKAGNSNAYSILDGGFDAMSNQAELVVEGTIEAPAARSGRSVPVYADQAINSFLAKINTGYETRIMVTKVYKGSHIIQDFLTLLIPSIKPGVLDDLALRGRYIFFLKKHPSGCGYVFVDAVKGRVRVFDYNGTLKVKRADQITQLRESRDYLDYDDFIWYLQLSLAAGRENYAVRMR